MRSYGRRFAAAIALFAVLALPAAASAETTVAQVSSGQLTITGVAGSPSMVEVRYQTAAEAGFGGISDRFVVEDAGGVRPVGTDCAAMDPNTVSCDARPVKAISAALGDGDDVMVVNAGEGDGVPKKYRTELDGQVGADVIRGGAADDVIVGAAGRDVVAGWSGDDLLLGGSGADGLIGFGGNDTLVAGKGRDALFAQKGRDLLFGGPQNDVLLARDGFRDPKINCGAGRLQRAITDRYDPRARQCTMPKPAGQGKRASPN